MIMIQIITAVIKGALGLISMFVRVDAKIAMEGKERKRKGRHVTKFVQSLNQHLA